MHRIPISLITGFLGSGKTSLINKLLHLPEASGTAVVVNEFGEIGVDQDLILASTDKVILLANGCFCCAMRGDLVTALDDLYRDARRNEAASFKRVVIETSGLADASPVIQLLLSEPSISARYRFDGVVTVVDAINGEATLDKHLESVKQVAVADLILLTKTDLLKFTETPDVTPLLNRLQAINPTAPVRHARWVEDTSLFDAFFRGGDRGDAVGEFKPVSTVYPSGHGHQFSSFCYLRETPFAENALHLLLNALGENLGPRLLRIKGIVNVREHPDRPAVIHGAQTLLHEIQWLEKWPTSDRRSRIVFITLDAERQLIEELVDLTDRLAANTARARERAGQHQSSAQGT